MEKAQASALKEEEEGQYADCPIEGCGEILLLDEMDYHLELHDQEVVDIAGQDHVTAKQEQQQQLHDAEEPRAGSSSSHHRSSPGHANRKDKPSTSTSSSSKQQTAISAWKHILNMPSSSRRLTDAEKRAAANAAPGKRLGVGRMGWSLHMLRVHVNSPFCRGAISASTHTRNACQTGSSTCSRNRAK
jgi:hypothetical protein